jgi:hypothetical protein
MLCKLLLEETPSWVLITFGIAYRKRKISSKLGWVAIRPTTLLTQSKREQEEWDNAFILAIFRSSFVLTTTPPLTVRVLRWASDQLVYIRLEAL